MSSLPQAPPAATVPLHPACPECEGAGRYRYHPDPTGERPPVTSRKDAGWVDGWWFKHCWWCGGTGIAP